MGHTPFGYRIENGIAVIDEEAAAKVRQLYKNYLGGLSLTNAAKEAGITIAQSECKVRITVPLPERTGAGQP